MKKPLILAIETSCDDTSAALVDGNCDVLSNVISSQEEVHLKYGGIVPELASREHIRTLIPIVEMALEKADVNIKDVKAVAVSANPGLIGSLLVGVSFAKGLAFSLKKPLIAVNHIFGHVFANFLEHKDIKFPFLSLIVSGGHTELVIFSSAIKYTILGKTVDDAAGEAFDKIGKLLGLPYPGGPHIDALAIGGNKSAIEFPLPMLKHDNFDFSFSGLKTAGMLYLKGRDEMNETQIHDFSSSFQYAIVEVLFRKTIRALEEHSIKTLLLAGGVAANSELRSTFTQYCAGHNINIYYPTAEYCTDNAAMIGAAAQFKYINKKFASLDLNASAVKGMKLL
ncbi:MAG: tRNA (adenosine(37)-N6)-threonylcarbamoyltransferase complex transferase subunit TsaD [Candidatus Cloacimonetes bacterium]|nr:tRNA (adenosine(37)-N6)-threonylcarbamoyltransferase complex transferase subunit TsaD [Candidatus Cloacimonadota bacterium]